MARRRASIALAAFVALLLVASACSKSSTTGDGAKPTIKIAMMGALTGNLAQLVIHEKQAAQLAFEQANAKGDLPVKIEYAPIDTQADKAKAATIAQGLKGDTTLLAVIGPAFSGESQTAGVVLEQAGIIRITPSATNPPLSKNGWTHWWQALGNDFSQGGVVAPTIVKYLKAPKVFVGHDKTQYGQGLATIVRDNIPKEGGTVAGFEAVDPGKKDYSALTAKVVSSGAQAFFWGGYSPEMILITKSLKQKGFKGQIVGADGSKDDTFLKDAAPANEGIILTCPCVDVTTSTDDATKKFVSDYKAKFTQDPGIYGGESWDSAQILIAAIKASGAPGSDIRAYREKINDYIKNLRGFKGVTKSLTFQANGELVPEAVETYLYKVEGKKYVALGKASDVLK